MKFDGKITIELSLREAEMLHGFVTEFEGEEYGGVNVRQKVKKDFIQSFNYALVKELEKHGR